MSRLQDSSDLLRNFPPVSYFISETIKILLPFPFTGPFFMSPLQALPAGCHFYLHSQVIIIVFRKGKPTPRAVSTDVCILAYIYCKKRSYTLLIMGQDEC
jgi:hypothetical protein